jgi:predicted metal-dependent phosphoesterase TrpH
VRVRRAPPPKASRGAARTRILGAVLIDLHCHSHCSDGTDPPRFVAERAAAGRVRLFCLTDHDTLAGHPATLGLGPTMQVLRGMELSCGERGRAVHLLLLGVDADGPGLGRLQQQITILQERRRERIVEICARFLRWDIHLDPAVILAEARGATPGRPHVAAALVKAKVVRTVREAFDRFLKDGGPADVPGPRLTVEEGTALGRAAGAQVSLAHPHTVGHPALVRALLERAREAGLGGIEAFYGPYASREKAAWLELGRELDLVITGGSDYHGKTTPEIGLPGVELPDALCARLLAWLGVSESRADA